MRGACCGEKRHEMHRRLRGKIGSGRQIDQRHDERTCLPATINMKIPQTQKLRYLSIDLEVMKGRLPLLVLASRKRDSPHFTNLYRNHYCWHHEKSSSDNRALHSTRCLPRSIKLRSKRTLTFRSFPSTVALPQSCHSCPLFGWVRYHRWLMIAPARSVP